MTRGAHVFWPLFMAMVVAGCAQQPAYYTIDSTTGQPVPVAQRSAPSQQGRERERGLFNSFAANRPSPVYAQQAYPQQAYPQHAYPQQAYAQQPHASQAYSHSGYLPPQPSPQPATVPPYRSAAAGMGGPYSPQSNPYALARWY